MCYIVKGGGASYYMVGLGGIIRPMGGIARAGRVFYGWWIVLACALTMGFGAGTFHYGFPNFFAPLVKEFGWSRTVTSGPFSLSRLESGLFGPVLGWLIERFGPQRVMMVGIILIGSGFIAMSRVNSLTMFYLAFLGLFALGFPCVTQSAFATVANWFIRKRSRAMSLQTVGAGVGGTVAIPLLAWLILHFGWRNTAFMVGIAILIAFIPVTFVIRHRPEQSGLLPDGMSAKEEEQKGVVKAEPQFTLRQALRTSTFWGLAIVSGIRFFAFGAVVIHMIPHLIDIGIDPQRAANVLAFLTFGSIPGRIIFGWLGDFVDKRYLMAVASALLGGTLYLFAHVDSINLLYLSMFLYGMPYGATIPVENALKADLFGRRHYPIINGVLGMVTALGGIVGPVFAGFVYDTTKSYAIAFNIFILLFLLSAIGYPFVRRPKPLLLAAPHPSYLGPKTHS